MTHNLCTEVRRDLFLIHLTSVNWPTSFATKTGQYKRAFQNCTNVYLIVHVRTRDPRTSSVRDTKFSLVRGRSGPRVLKFSWPASGPVRGRLLFISRSVESAFSNFSWSVVYSGPQIAWSVDPWFVPRCSNTSLRQGLNNFNFFVYQTRW